MGAECPKVDCQEHCVTCAQEHQYPTVSSCECVCSHEHYTLRETLVREQEDVDGLSDFSARRRRVVQQVGPHNSRPAQERVISAEKVGDLHGAPSCTVNEVDFFSDAIEPFVNL